MACMFHRLLPPIALSGLLAGCVLPGRLDVPHPDNYPASSQPQARAVHHWEVLASDVAERLSDQLAEWPAGTHPIHITIDQDSSFNQSFLKLLRVHLLQRGITLSPQPGELELLIQTQVVQQKAAPHPGRTEVLINTTLKSQDRYLTSTADLYYIEAQDKPLYQPPPPPPPPPPMKTWQVVTP